MFVVKRTGDKESVSFDKILTRLNNHAKDLTVDTAMITQKVIEGLYQGITTEILDELASYISTSLNTIHPDYTILGSRICISNLHKKTNSDFREITRILYNNNGSTPQISREVLDIVEKYGNEINKRIDYARDYLIDYFGFKTLEKVYLMKVGGKTVERPQHMWMRVAIGLHGDDLEHVFETYDYMSRKYFIHASPTLFNAGTDHQQLLSCFLLGMDDSIDGIYKNLHNTAMIMKGAGGIGIHCSNVRSKNSQIKSTNGLSNGIIPMLKLYNDTCRFVTQSGKRAGSVAVYLEPHHADILDFLNLRKNNGIEEERCRELFLALWVSDLFMNRVKNDRPWTLFSEDVAVNLSNVYGKEYETLYKKYEENGIGVKTVKAREIWKAILTSMIETGTPYILYKDTSNRRSNQQNIGTVRSSNLCVAGDTLILTDEGEIPIGELKDMYVNVWNGKEYSNVQVKQTGQNKELLKILFSNGSVLECTKYHKFYIRDGHDVYVLEAQQLQPNMLLSSWSLPNGNVVNSVIVTEIVDEGKIGDTFCFSEPKEHSGIFNGVKTGQCAEIIEYSDDKEYACCTLASISLPAYVISVDGKQVFDFEELGRVSRILVRNLNIVIDKNHYPVPETELSNKKHRPLGIGIQGLADTFLKMGWSFDSVEARRLNREMMECIYYHAMDESCNLAKRDGAYSTFMGSPLSKGEFQFNLAGYVGEKELEILSGRWNFAELRKKVIKYGVRNSLLLALMPTASTSNILGNTECFEPITSNIYLRRTIAGEFIIINQYLVQDLIKLGLWSKEMKNKIIVNNGSIMNIPEIPTDVKEKYQTVWEISRRSIIDMAIERGLFVCQSQSMNLYFPTTDMSVIHSAMFYGWEKGLKTGIYYTRVKPSVEAQKFTIEPKFVQTVKKEDKKDEPECLMCSS